MSEEYTGNQSQEAPARLTHSVPTLLIFGARSTALEIFDVVQLAYQHHFVEQLFVVGNDEEVETPAPQVRDADLAELVGTSAHNFRYILSFANQKLRAKCVEQMKELGVAPQTLLHPTVVMSPSASVGEGCYIAASTALSTNAVVSDHCIVNFNCTIGHDSQLDAHVMVNPGARVSGNVHIGARTMIGANAFVFQGTSVGTDCVIDAMTYVDRDIPNKQICSSKQALTVLRRVVF